LEETPITGRKRLVLISGDQFKQLTDLEYQVILTQFKDMLLPRSDSRCKRVERIANRLLHGNKDLEQIYDKEWSISVVDAPEIRNAFVLPNGQIFVFTGMLNFASSDDELAAILGHEMAHAVLSHGAEQASYAQFVDMMIVGIFALIWAVVPSDLIGLISHYLFKTLVDITTNLPYNRMLEVEADEVGLKLASKACFDIREAVVFWSKMMFKEEMEGTEMPIDIEFLATHPNHANRVAHLNDKMEEALKMRECCNCPRLSSRDPRVLFELEKEAFLRNLKKEQLKYVVTLKTPPRSPIPPIVPPPA
jgi:Zn-dependent protease with chaperone function